MKKTAVSLLSALVLMFAANTLLFAQSGEETAAKAAEQAGKLSEALTQYMTALQKTADGSADEQRIREMIIGLAQRMSPPLPIPAEARRFWVHGNVWIKEAKGPSDFGEAAKEYAKTLRIAPWWGDAYYNRGVVLEKIGKYNEAIQSYKLYLLASPRALDVSKVEDHVYELEVREEKAQKAVEQAATEEQRRKKQEAAVLHNLSGTWVISGLRNMRYAVSMSGNSIEIYQMASYVDGRWYPLGPHQAGNSNKYHGSISGLEIRGTHDQDMTNYGGLVTSRPMTGTISADGNKIHLDYITVWPPPNRPGHETKESMDLERP